MRKAERVILEEMRWASHARGRQKNKNLKSPGRPEVRQFPRVTADVQDDVVYDARQKLAPIDYSGYSKQPVSIISWRQQAREQLRDLAVSRAMDTALHASTIAARKTLSDPHANRAVPQLPPYLGDTSPIRIDDVDTMEYLAALDNTEVPTLAVPSAAWGTPPVHRSASPYGSKDFLEAVKFKKKEPLKEEATKRLPLRYGRRRYLLARYSCCQSWTSLQVQLFLQQLPC